MADRQPDRDKRPKMTMRVYTMAHDGIRITRSAIVAVLAGEKNDASRGGRPRLALLLAECEPLNGSWPRPR
ncbi:hypothetical protein [Streptomyces rapamycinicus]|uniref:Uncharacterized protein n=2 Tax=Streptomyces rapamycinicus TaxID=1226757 RepID=A0A0A0NTL6_STRRN|nr:hypothetical protein [Streptomyces rapamycinicus]AGP58070.1 hypothetical protein M271_33275 [Streptomyces rapamycinicus NRRL 5491]MBB4785745.1 hypothetical protein [Streptomyces rapamycinicus]RLV78790.1 hypothetical protein D3C57_110435 [Streptomyces rapamycinicus NRRL 5491]UTO65902.1 hypothetical protein LJB45_28665 [Streptomyces rapamycinicus]UTP33857.1 hypothetical protein LIV37_33795 [Streptomyces rapamycinicus NRRL 5491]